MRGAILDFAQKAIYEFYYDLQPIQCAENVHEVDDVTLGCKV